MRKYYNSARLKFLSTRWLSTCAQELFQYICFVQLVYCAPVWMSSAESHLGVLDSIVRSAKRLCENEFVVWVTNGVFGGDTLSLRVLWTCAYRELSVIFFIFISISFCSSIDCLISWFWAVLVYRGISFSSSICQVILIIMIVIMWSIAALDQI